MACTSQTVGNSYRKVVVRRFHCERVLPHFTQVAMHVPTSRHGSHLSEAKVHPVECNVRHMLEGFRRLLCGSWRGSLETTGLSEPELPVLADHRLLDHRLLDRRLGNRALGDFELSYTRQIKVLGLDGPRWCLHRVDHAARARRELSRQTFMDHMITRRHVLNFNMQIEGHHRLVSVLVRVRRGGADVADIRGMILT